MQYRYPNLNHLTNFAADYDCNAYGAGTYNNTDCVSGANPTPSPDTGGLVDTGYNIIIPVALGLALIIAAAILITKPLIRRRKQVN